MKRAMAMTMMIAANCMGCGYTMHWQWDVVPPVPGASPMPAAPAPPAPASPAQPAAQPKA